MAAECEVEGVFTWFQNEMGVDKAVPGKLWDGNTWHRPVMDKAKAFTVESPWFGFIAGAHIPETYKATLHDAFGLRERFTVSFAEPVADVVDAAVSAADAAAFSFSLSSTREAASLATLAAFASFTLPFFSFLSVA